MATEVRERTLPQAAARRIEEHRALAADLRQRFGDPQAHLTPLLRDQFTPESFLGEDREHLSPRASGTEERQSRNNAAW